MIDTLTDLISIFENSAIDFCENKAEGDNILEDAFDANFYVSNDEKISYSFRRGYFVLSFWTSLSTRLTLDKGF